MNVLENEGFALLRCYNDEEQEYSDDEEVNIAIEVDKVNQPVEAAGPLSEGSGMRSREDEVLVILSDSDTEALDPVSVPSSSPVLLGSRGRAMEEDDNNSQVISKQFR